jgi:methylmalonyl-CoA/ethylmalonyl-CoA epimerase
MSNSGQPVIKVTEIEQLCFVVHNIDKSVEALWNTFGIGPWMFREFHPDSMAEMSYHGKPARFSFKVARSQNKLGGVEIELVEPLEGDTIYRDFLREHGEGFHHVGWHKVDSLESFNETSRALEKAGFPCIMSGKSSSMAFAYFDTTRVLHTVLEVLWPYSSGV